MKLPAPAVTATVSFAGWLVSSSTFSTVISAFLGRLVPNWTDRAPASDAPCQKTRTGPFRLKGPSVSLRSVRSASWAPIGPVLPVYDRVVLQLRVFTARFS